MSLRNAMSYGLSIAGTAALLACGDASAPAGTHDGCDALELAPIVVPLPVDTSMISSLAVNIPSGTYRAIEARIRPSTDLSGASVRVIPRVRG
jgi:hypothetical protein